jgi:hypothetical protein
MKIASPCRKRDRLAPFAQLTAAGRDVHDLTGGVNRLHVERDPSGTVAAPRLSK